MNTKKTSIKKGGAMRKGFTMLELIIVIIILGVLATLGFNQYGRMVERARGAEARSILGDLRKFAAAYRLERGSVTGITQALLNIGTLSDQVPSACRTSHYFAYTFAVADPVLTLTATRCTNMAASKNPAYRVANTLILSSDLSSGADSWTGTGGY